MTQAHFVKKARKDYPSAGIKKGDSYYYWEFRFGGLHRSKIAPKRSQLTQSEFLGRIYDIEDRISNISGDTASDLQSQAEEIASEIRELAEEQEDKRSNMPDQLQDSAAGELLQNRADSCNEMADELENIDFDAPNDVEDEYTAYTPKEGETCKKCEQPPAYETDDGEKLCEACFDQWREEKFQEQSDAITEIVETISNVTYNGE
jgi:hypothetical protein